MPTTDQGVYLLTIAVSFLVGMAIFGSGLLAPANVSFSNRAAATVLGALGVGALAMGVRWTWRALRT